MDARTPDVEAFIAALEAAFAKAPKEPHAAEFLARVFGMLEHPGLARTTPASRMDLCALLPEAYAAAGATSPEMQRLASAFAALEPRINWQARTVEGPNASASWASGHGDAVIIGVKGVEHRTDVTIGVTLLAPDVRYPDHWHAPEEVYMVLTWGRFQHGDSPWVAVPSGHTYHNVPNIRHAMASEGLPLLAFWVLIMDEGRRA